MHPPIDSDDRLTRASDCLLAAKRVLAFTGAGVSAESGVPTFRGAGGLWEGHRVEDVATPHAFARNPELVWRFYNQRRAGLCRVEPNPAHLALALLEQRWGSDRFTLATQNVDGLHRAAGSRHVLELHGNLSRVRCTGCGVVENRGLQPLPALPKCTECGGLLRPDIVWFYESLPDDVWSLAAAAAERCDCMLVVGTSAVVYPAAGLIDTAADHGATIIEINLERTGAGGKQAIGLYGPAGQMLPELVSRL